jgi:hypothetical protein
VLRESDGQEMMSIRRCTLFCTVAVTPTTLKINANYAANLSPPKRLYLNLEDAWPRIPFFYCEEKPGLILKLEPSFCFSLSLSYPHFVFIPASNSPIFLMLSARLYCIWFSPSAHIQNQHYLCPEKLKSRTYTGRPA